MKRLALPGLGLIVAFVAGWTARGDVHSAAAAPAVAMAPAAMSCCSTLLAPEEAKAIGTEAPSRREVIQRALALTVSIRSGDRYGAGVIATRGGLMLTAEHVIRGRSSVEVRRLGHKAQRATVLESDEDLDLALLQLGEAVDLPDPATPIELSTVSSGDEVFSVGSPRRLEFSVDRGIVSFPGREIFGLRYLQTDLPSNRGSSGGPIFDTQGRLVALTTFVVRDSERLAFGLPIEYAYARFSGHLASGLKVAGWVNPARFQEPK